MSYHTNIRHQEIVAILGTRNLPLRLVYAHIANYTQVKGAWCGARQKLADEIEIDRTVASRKLDELITRGLVIAVGDNYRAVCIPERAECTEERAERTEERAECTEERAECTEKRAERTEITSPTPPINNKINNKMRNNENIARDTIATPNPTDLSSFERLLFFYRKRVGNCQLSEATINDSRHLWEKFPLWKRLRLFEVLNDPNGWFRPRLDWTLSAFNPQPVNLNGTSEGGMKLASGEAKTAFYNGSYGIYSLRDIQDFALKEPPKKKESKEHSE